jgi:hypothetical protein
MQENERANIFAGEEVPLNIHIFGRKMKQIFVATKCTVASVG